MDGAGDFMDPNAWGQEPETVNVHLSDNDDSLFATISYEDWAWVKEFRWSAITHGDGRSRVQTYARRSVSVGSRTNRRQQTIYLHVEVCKRISSPPTPEHLIGDHMDGYPLNDTRSNLRWATLSENCLNRHGFYAKQSNFLRMRDYE